jgi:hypothetical protein
MNRTAAFRISSVVTSTIPAHVFSTLEAFTEASGLSRSAAIRNALLHHAHKVSSLTTPPMQAPCNVSTNIKPDSLRREYEAHAKRCGITMSELVLRCLSAYIDRTKP